MTYNLGRIGNHVVTYDESNNTVYEDGRPSGKYKPTFIPNGDNEPDFFGVVDTTSNKVYSINGKTLPIANEDDITL